MAWNSAGTIQILNNSRTVTGTGTLFSSQVSAGMPIQLPNGILYEVESVQSDTELTLARAVTPAVAAGSRYWVMPLLGDANSNSALYTAVNSLRQWIEKMLTGSDPDTKEFLLSVTNLTGIQVLRWHCTAIEGNGDQFSFTTTPDGNTLELNAFANGSTPTVVLSINRNGTVSFPNGGVPLPERLAAYRSPKASGSCNELTETGWYYVNIAVTERPPVNLQYFIEVIAQSNANICKQIAYGYSSAGTDVRYSRTKINASTWSDWKTDAEANGLTSGGIIANAALPERLREQIINYGTTNDLNSLIMSTSVMFNTGTANSPWSAGLGLCDVYRAAGSNVVLQVARLGNGQADIAMQRGGNAATGVFQPWVQPNSIVGYQVSNSAANYSTLYGRMWKNASDTTSFENVAATNSYIMLNPMSNSGSGNCVVGVGRLTDTTSASGVQFIGYVGNNTNAIDFNFRTGASAISYVCSNGGNFAIGTTSAPDKLNVAGNITPATDNAHSLGVADRRFSTVFAATGTINTSDIRVKFNFKPLELGLDFVCDLNPASFMREDGETLVEYVDVQVGEEEEVVREWDEIIGEDADGTPITEKRQETRTVPTWSKEERACGVRKGKRTHLGFSAQEIKATLDKYGFTNCAMHTLENPDDPESLQGIRPDQLMAPMVKAIQELSKMVKDLQEEIIFMKEDKNAR